MEINDPKTQEQLHEARVQSAKEMLRRAEDGIQNAQTPDEIAIWTERLVQARQQLERVEADEKEKIAA